MFSTARAMLELKAFEGPHFSFYLHAIVVVCDAPCRLFAIQKLNANNLVFQTTPLCRRFGWGVHPYTPHTKKGESHQLRVSGTVVEGSRHAPYINISNPPIKKREGSI